MVTNSVTWPDGKVAAVSLTFDDARESQLDCGLPILDSHGVKATFFVSLKTLEKRPDEWRQALANGHEIGNHTVRHPCNVNFPFARAHAPEDYTLDEIEAELIGAGDTIERIIGVRPVVFGYPCGEQFVGRGRQTRSYVPIVARHFLVGRGFGEWGLNDPLTCDLAKACSQSIDCMDSDQLISLVDRAAEGGRWLIATGHDVGPAPSYQTVPAEALDALCRHITGASSALWVDTVGAIGDYVRRGQAC